MTATLIACSHGTHDERGRAAITELIERTRELAPDVRVEPAFVDVEEPRIDDVVDRFVADGPVVVVPLLLSTGFHTRVDIARAIGRHPGLAVSTAALGPHPLLAAVLADRLTEQGVRDDDTIVLAAAGSSDPTAADDVRAMAALLADRLGLPVHAGFAAGAGERITDVIEREERAGAERILVASYVLAPGHFARVIAAAGATSTRPLAPDARIAELIVRRYRSGLTALPQPLADSHRYSA